MADFTLEALRDEIVNDPEGIGYKEVDSTWKADQAIADLMNDPALGTAIRRKNVLFTEVKTAVLQADFESLAPGEVDYMMFIMSGTETLDARSDNIFDGVTQIFGPSTDTRAALVALFQKQGSRAEVLWDESFKVNAAQVGRAFNLL